MTRGPLAGLEGVVYSLTQNLSGQLTDVAWAAFDAGDDLLRSATGLLFDTAAGELNVSEWIAAARQQWRETLCLLTPEGLAAAVQEARNKYEVYNLVKHVRDRLRFPQDGTLDLELLVDRAYALGPFADLWAVEGLGHDYTETFWIREILPEGVLNGPVAARLPASSLTMMHAGFGLSCAQHLMQTITPYSGDARMEGVLRRFRGLCLENSRPGYVGAAFESLGLVTRTWHEQLVPFVDRLLRRIDSAMAAFFWHGAGRAYYFLPLYFVPGAFSPWDAADREPPDEFARKNAVAGLAWATTLVNVRHPWIMQNLLRCRGHQLSRDDAFPEGVASATMVAMDVTPEDAHFRSFAEYRPGPAGSSTAEHWNRLVADPVDLALREYLPLVQRHGLPGEIFRYQPLADLGHRLKEDPPAAKWRESPV